MIVNRAARGTAWAGMAVLLLATASCGNVRHPFQGVVGAIPSPDEFQVISREPLQMPDSSELPEPRPGAPSPLDPDPQRDAVQALLGAAGAPVETATAPSVGEQVLLSSANAAAVSNDIRVQLEEDKIASDAKKPYTPRSLGDLLGGGDKEKIDEAEVLDPIAESQRLQREGVHTPSDPQAKAEASEQKDTGRATQYYTAGKPRLRLDTPGTGPAY